MSFVRLRKHIRDMMLLKHLRKLHSFLFESRIEKEKDKQPHWSCYMCFFLVWDLVGWTIKVVLNTIYAHSGVEEPLVN